MNEDIEEIEDDPAGHLTEEVLINYQFGRLNEPDLEKVQYHLIQCDECLAVCKDVKDFFESSREYEESIGEESRNREFGVFWDRVETEGKAESLASRRKREGFRSSSVLMFALAASLLVALSVAAVWVVKLRSQNQTLVGRLEAEQTSWADRLKELEKENLSLQERASAVEQSTPPQQNHDSTRGELTQPALNLPIYDVYSLDSIRRSAEKEQLNRIKVPSTAKSFVLLLNGENQSSDHDYTIDIINSRGKVIWRGKGLRRDKYGNFTLIMGRTFLVRGNYQLKLYAQEGQGSRPIAEYVLRIE
jgi:hypothetical protein